MALIVRLHWTLLYFLTEALVQAGRNKPTPPLRSNEERLLSHLFAEYNPSARPVINSSRTVEVTMQFSMMHIQELNVRSQILTATGLLILEWVDERLTWTPDDFNLTEIVVEAKRLWVPEFAVINGADKIYGDYREFRAVLTCNGTLRWEPGGVFRTMCEIDITYFPFDEQSCALVFGAWSYHTTKMNLTNSSSEINMDSYEKNGEWQIVSTAANRDEFSYECCPDEKFSFVAFNLHIRRRYTFYVMNVILPSMVTSILLLSIFYCPPGQKVQIGVVVLLSFRIFLLNVTDSIPKTSDHIPLLGIYLTCTMAITTLSMVLTVMVLNLHAISDRPVPPWILVFCGRRRPSASEKDDRDRPGRRRRRRMAAKGAGTSTSKQSDSYDEHSPIMMNGGNLSDQAMGSQETSFIPISRQRGRLIENNNSSMHLTFDNEDHSEGSSSELGPPDYSRDWTRLAEVVDRLFFWAFLIAIMAVTILLFHPLTKEFLIPRPKRD